MGHPCGPGGSPLSSATCYVVSFGPTFDRPSVMVPPLPASLGRLRFPIRFFWLFSRWGLSWLFAFFSIRFRYSSVFCLAFPLCFYPPRPGSFLARALSPWFFPYLAFFLLGPFVFFTAGFVVAFRLPSGGWGSLLYFSPGLFLVIFLWGFDFLFSIRLFGSPPRGDLCVSYPPLSAS